MGIFNVLLFRRIAGRTGLFAIFIFIICANNIQAQDRIIDSRTGVEIIFSANGTIFPDSWYSPEINAKAVSLEQAEYERSIELINQVLLMYPESVIRLNLQKIYILKSIEFYGVQFGGTNSSDALYLTNDGIDLGYTDRYFKQLFHAEFSSILFRNYPQYFNKVQWESLNPETFEYGQGEVEVLDASLNLEEFNIELNTIGFLNEYATSSLENDFNSFAKNIFEPLAEFRQLLSDFYLLQKKAELLIQFYEQIDPYFSNHFTALITTDIELSVKNSISIYPNPVKNILYLDYLPENSRVSILDFKGKEIHSTKAQSESEQIYMGNFADGIYFIIVENDYVIFNRKIFKK